MTMNTSECRIALRGGLDIKRFFRFVFLNFIDYEVVEKHNNVFGNNKYQLGTLSDIWSKELHIDWLS